MSLGSNRAFLRLFETFSLRPSCQVRTDGQICWEDLISQLKGALPPSSSRGGGHMRANQDWLPIRAYPSGCFLTVGSWRCGHGGDWVWSVEGVLDSVRWLLAMASFSSSSSFLLLSRLGGRSGPLRGGRGYRLSTDWLRRWEPALKGHVAPLNHRGKRIL